jgi:pyruvate dehydrogenase E2 component (dihydrolipoamide acetyltransferase)
MATEIKMPQLSDTMDSGKIVSWSKQEGDAVSRGDILAEVETDKANLEIECFHNGTLLKINTPAGSSAAVGEIIAYIGEEGEAIPESTPSQEVPAKTEASTEESKEEENNSPQSQPTTSSESQTSDQKERPHLNGAASSETDTKAQGDDERIKASPLAKKLAEERGVDLSSISGTGPEGRIVKRDIESASSSKQSPPQETSAPQPPTTPTPQPTNTTPSDGGTLVPFSKMRATIARRMQQSVNEAPHFYVTTSIRMDNVLELRSLLKEKSGYEKASINHFILKAVAYGITAEPRVNYAVREENNVFQPNDINLGIITAVEDGLLIPVIKNADSISFKDLIFEARAAVERARAGRPNAQDLVGGTFSISNMGMFDVESFTAVINPGQGSVLAVSSILEQAVAQNGELFIANMMKATISVDHRIIDGVMAGNFLKAFKEALENPALLLI